MPVTDRKGSKKTKKGAENVPPPPPLTVTVRDCMVWPEPKPKGKGLKNSETNPEVYRSTLVRRSMSSDQLENRGDTAVPYPRGHPVRRDDGTVIEALRGWPGTGGEEEDRSNYVFDREARKEDGRPTMGENSGKNSKKKKGKKGETKEVEEPVYMSDLIQHRYLNEYAEKRRREMDRDRRRREAAEAVRAGRRVVVPRHDVKANRTSQLRSIALADRVETKPLDLWKMPRFSRGVDPHLQTTANGSALHHQGKKLVRGGGGGVGGGMLGGEDECGGGACCCDYSYRDPRYADMYDEELQTGADSGDRYCESTVEGVN